jgi:hypothetical protein
MPGNTTSLYLVVFILSFVPLVVMLNETHLATHVLVNSNVAKWVLASEVVIITGYTNNAKPA